MNFTVIIITIMDKIIVKNNGKFPNVCITSDDKILQFEYYNNLLYVLTKYNLYSIDNSYNKTEIYSSNIDCKLYNITIGENIYIVSKLQIIILSHDKKCIKVLNGGQYNHCTCIVEINKHKFIIYECMSYIISIHDVRSPYVTTCPCKNMIYDIYYKNKLIYIRHKSTTNDWTIYDWSMYDKNLNIVESYPNCYNHYITKYIQLYYDDYFIAQTKNYENNKISLELYNFKSGIFEYKYIINELPIKSNTTRDILIFNDSIYIMDHTIKSNKHEYSIKLLW